MSDKSRHWLIEYRLPIFMCGGLCLGLVVVIYQTITSLSAGQVSLGRYGELQFALSQNPLLFWIGICVYVAAGIGTAAMIFVLARKDLVGR